MYANSYYKCWHLGRVLLVWFQNRNTQNRRYLGAEWTEWVEYGSLGISRICVLLGKFWREMIHGGPVTCRLENWKLNGIATQSFYHRCRCAGLGSVSLLVLEQKELSVCVIQKMCPCLVKRNEVGITSFVQKPRPFFQLSQHQEKERIGMHLHYAKHLQIQKIRLSSSPLKFLANKANWKIRGTHHKPVLMAIFQRFVFPNFRETFFSRHANASGACPDTIVPRSLCQKYSVFIICVL